MSANKLALIRYKTIDACLRNRYRKWTLDDLIEKVSDVLYEYEGIENGVSKRTIQADIQTMRSDKLGYNAPIIVKDRKYYSYGDDNYSITRVPINEADMEKMKEIVGVLKQFNGFTYFDEMSEMIARLENSIYRSNHQQQNYIQFENNKQLKGLEYISPLYQMILKRNALLIEYQSFKARQPQQFVCYPYLLKQYRNRWFLIGGIKTKNGLQIMALDRIVAFEPLLKEAFIDQDAIDFDQYFSDLIGVTKNSGDRAHKVTLRVNKQNAPYVITKPLHHSQIVLEEDADGMTIQIEVILNFELEREILGFGECVKVISPRLLASRIRKRLHATMRLYEKETDD